MKDAIYIHDQTVIMNFSTFYPASNEAFLSSKVFAAIAKKYLLHLKAKDPDTYKWLTKNQSLKTFIPKMQMFLKKFYVLNIDEMESRLFENRDLLAYVIDDFYTFWRKQQRLATIKISASSSGYVTNFIEADTRFNNMLRYTYRNFQEKVQGYKNHVYRQLQAGTDACMVLSDVKWRIPRGYETLRKIPFASQILLKPPLLLYPKGNKRYGSFTLSDHNPLLGLSLDLHQWYCYPAKVGPLLILIYVNFDFAFSGIANANLFELADRKEVANNKIDGIMIFGLPDKTEDATYTYDEKNDMWIGKVPYMQKIEYFGYMKKMVLTMHNAIMMKKGRLPIHGSMINLHLRNKKTIGVVFIGDSGAGKSETIEAMELLEHPDLLGFDVVFDDMGSFFIEDGRILAQGSEIGAFIRLDDLDKGSPYKSMDRSIFMNPDSTNARIVVPISSYNCIVAKHPIHYLFYCNNYENKFGCKIADTPSDIKDVFVEGKRMALATTHEVGISTTYFANPFGPMQDQETCDKLLDTYFDALDRSDIQVGEVYTGLGVTSGSLDHLTTTAKELIDLFLAHKD